MERPLRAIEPGKWMPRVNWGSEEAALAIDSREVPAFLARVADFVSGQRFPAKKADLVARARHANTSSDVYVVLLNLPDRIYESEADLRRAARELVTAGRT
jgi:hypothetical protein